MEQERMPRMVREIEKNDLEGMALFGMKAKQWRDKNPDKKSNIRDYASTQLALHASYYCFPRQYYLLNVKHMTPHFGFGHLIPSTAKRLPELICNEGTSSSLPVPF